MIRRPMISFTRRQAEMYREQINSAATSLPDDEAAKTPMLFEQWVVDKTYVVGERVCYIGKLYKVLQSHTSQADWTPDVAVSLFAEILIPDPSVIPEWVQPGSTNPYMAGDKVRHNGKIWISLINYNVWEPGAVGTASLWEEVDK